MSFIKGKGFIHDADAISQIAADPEGARDAAEAVGIDLGEADEINSQPGTAAKVVSTLGPPRVGRMGDSLTENGGFPPGPNMSIIGQFGRGYTVTAGSTPTSNATYNHWMFGGSANGNSKQILAGSTVEMSCGNPSAVAIRGDRFSFYYLTVPGSGTFDLQYQANGGAWVDIQTGINADGTLAGQVIAGTLPASATPSYKLRVRNVTGAGFAFIGAGVYQQHGTGIIWLGDMLANGGVDLPNPLTTTSAVYTPILRDLSPDLILSCWADDAAKWDVGGDFQTLMDRFTAATSFTVASVVTTNNSSSITFPSNFQVQPGMVITGTNIPVGTRIYSVQSATAALITAAASASGTITATLSPRTDWVTVSPHPLTIASDSIAPAGLAIQREWALRNKQTFINMFAAFHGDSQWMADNGFKGSANDAHLTTAGGAVRWHHLWTRLPVGTLNLGGFGERAYGIGRSPISLLGGGTNSITEPVLLDRQVYFGGVQGGIVLLNRSDQNTTTLSGTIWSDNSEFWVGQNNNAFATSGQSSLFGWHPAANDRMLGGRGNFRWRGAFTGMTVGYRETSSDTTFATDDFTINVTSGSPTITLPAATAVNVSTSAAHNVAAGIAGKIFIIRNTGGGVVTVATTSSQTIDGAAPTTLASGSLKVQSTGTNWITIP